MVEPEPTPVDPLFAYRQVAKLLGVPLDRNPTEAHLTQVLDSVTALQQVAADTAIEARVFSKMAALMTIAKKNYLQLRDIENEPVTKDGAEREARIRARLETALGVTQEEEATRAVRAYCTQCGWESPRCETGSTARDHLTEHSAYLHAGNVKGEIGEVT